MIYLKTKEIFTGVFSQILCYETAMERINETTVPYNNSTLQQWIGSYKNDENEFFQKTCRSDRRTGDPSNWPRRLFCRGAWITTKRDSRSTRAIGWITSGTAGVRGSIRRETSTRGCGTITSVTAMERWDGWTAIRCTRDSGRKESR